MKRLYIFEALKRLTFLNTKRLYIYDLWMFSLFVVRNVSSRILVIKNYSKKDWTLSNYEFPNCHCKQVMNNTTYVIGPKSIVGALQVKLMFPRRTGRPLSVTLWETKQLVSSQVLILKKNSRWAHRADTLEVFRDPRHLDPLPHKSRVPIRSLLPTGLRLKYAKRQKRTCIGSCCYHCLLVTDLCLTMISFREVIIPAWWRRQNSSP